MVREVPFHPLQSYFSASCHDDMPNMQVGQFTPLYVGHPQTASDANNVGIAFKEEGGRRRRRLLFHALHCVPHFPPFQSVFEPYISPAYPLTMHGGFDCRGESFIWASAMKHARYSVGVYSHGSAGSKALLRARYVVRYLIHVL